MFKCKVCCSIWNILWYMRFSFSFLWHCTKYIPRPYRYWPSIEKTNTTLFNTVTARFIEFVQKMLHILLFDSFYILLYQARNRYKRISSNKVCSMSHVVNACWLNTHFLWFKYSTTLVIYHFISKSLNYLFPLLTFSAKKYEFVSILRVFERCYFICKYFCTCEGL